MGNRPDESLWWFEHGEVKCQIWPDYVLFATIKEFVDPIIRGVDHCEIYNMDFAKRWMIFRPHTELEQSAVLYDSNHLQVPEPILLAMTLMGIDYV